MTVRVKVQKPKRVGGKAPVYVVDRPATLAEYMRTYRLKSGSMRKALARAKKELCPS